MNLRLEVFVSFVDLVGVDDYRYLYFLFIILLLNFFSVIFRTLRNGVKGEWVNQWVVVVHRQLSNFQLYHGEKKLIFNETMMMRSALYQTNTLSWVFIVLSHWNSSPRIAMSSHSDTLSWFRANQSLLFLCNAARRVEKQHIPILFGSIRSGLEPTIYRTLTITPPILYAISIATYSIHGHQSL
jgi:hypothetical protein